MRSSAAHLLVVGVGDQVQVGDPGRRCRCRLGCFGAGFRVGVAGDHVRHRRAVAPAVADVDVLEVERGEHQLDLAADQDGVDLVGVAVQGHRRGLGDGAVLRPQERLGQLAGEAIAGRRPEPSQPASQRASGVWPVSECTRWW